MTAATPTLTLVRGAEYGQEIQGLIFPIRIVTSNAETLDQAIEQSHQAERLVRSWNSLDPLVEALTMVRDADNDCKLDGLPSIPPAARAKIDAALTASGAA